MVEATSVTRKSLFTLIIAATIIIAIFAYYTEQDQETRYGCAGGVSYLEMDRRPTDTIRHHVEQESNYSKFNVSNLTQVIKNCHKNIYRYDLSKNGTSIGYLEVEKPDQNNTVEVKDTVIKISKDEFLGK